MIPDVIVWPLLAALVLTGIHVYLGIHVIGRKVIFVDLALAQIAALGAAVGVLLGYEIQHSPWGLFGYSLAFTLLAALVFSITKVKSDEIPHEAIIGITYAVAVAATMLALAKSPLGPQEFDRMMKGTLLYATKGKVAITAGIYAAVGGVHWIFRKQFFALSFANGEGLARPRLWDFFFYATFGFVVTSSVAIAGVFLVFCLLVIPAVGALLFAKRTEVRLAIGWIGGGVLCVAGVLLGYHRNLDISPLIVVLFAAALVVAGLVKFVLRSPSKAVALGRIAAFAGIFALFGVGLWLFRNRGEDPFEQAIHMAHSEEETKKLQALSTFERHPERKVEWLEHAITLLDDSNPQVRTRALEILVKLHDPSAAPAVSRMLRDREDHVREQAVDFALELGRPEVVKDLIAAGDAEEAADLRIHMYEAALEFGSKEAVDRMLALLADEGIPKRRKEHAYKTLAPHVDFPRVLTPGALADCTQWWSAHRDRMVWREVDGHFRFVLE